jgi:hypothetical protein
MRRHTANGFSSGHRIPGVLATVVMTVAFSTVMSASSMHPITATLEGCVLVTDPRLAEALWFATGTFQAVAFDDPFPGCDTTIAHPVLEPFHFDEDRENNTLKAWIDLAKLPSCGRRQYDLHYYLDFGQLDPMGLRSLVIDTGVECIEFSRQPPDNHVPEPSTLATMLGGLIFLACARALLASSR